MRSTAHPAASLQLLAAEEKRRDPPPKRDTQEALSEEQSQVTHRLHYAGLGQSLQQMSGFDRIPDWVELS